MRYLTFALRIFYIVQKSDQLWIAACKADTHSSHGTGFGEGLDYQEIVIFLYKLQC